MLAPASASLRCGSTIRGLSIVRFATGANLFGAAGGNLIVGNYIGLDTTGAKVSNGTGVSVSSPSNKIGDVNVSDGNVIAGNTGTGVVLSAGATGSQILGNLIGTNAAGAAGLGNGGNGISLSNASNVTIGSVGSGRNIISGNTAVGVIAQATTAAVSGLQIVGNYVGVTPDGAAARGNLNHGVSLFTSGGFTIINTLINQNVIGANLQGIVILSGATGTQITGNIVGLNATATAPIPNTGLGINVLGANTIIGGTSAADGNVLSGNGQSAIYLQPGAAGTQIFGNLIGTNSSNAVLGNGASNVGPGIYLDNVSNVTIGSLTGTGRNVIVSNTGNGITVQATTASISGVQIIGNRVGVAADGVTARGNGQTGVALNASGGFTLSNTLIDQNVISANTQLGINISAAGVTGTQITGNIVGLDAFGVAPRANNGGIRVAGANTQIGGTTANAANVIAGNAFEGISVNVGGTGTRSWGIWSGQIRTATLVSATLQTASG